VYGSAATLIHELETSRVDYCNSVLAGSPKVTTDKLMRTSAKFRWTRCDDLVW